MKHGSQKNIGYLLTRSAQIWNKKLIQEFEKNGVHDMKPSFGSVFIPLFDFEKVTAKKIAEFSNLSKQTVGSYIKLLEKLNYISKVEDRDDKRNEFIFLTKKGELLRTIADKSVRNSNAYFEQKISAEELSHLRAILTKVLG